MQCVQGMPPMIAADNRRIPGWRVLREHLSVSNGSPKLKISSCCTELIRCLPALLCDPDRPEDAANEPHSVTHAPEALRYAVMSRYSPPIIEERHDFVFSTQKKSPYFD
jgi:phage terminase large subunit